MIVLRAAATDSYIQTRGSVSYFCLIHLSIYSDWFSFVPDLSNPEVYRDLSRPVGALNRERLLKLLVIIRKVTIFSRLCVRQCLRAILLLGYLYIYIHAHIHK